MVMRISRIGLTPNRMVKAHQRKGHDVSRFFDVRSLDLELVDKVRGRNRDLGYAAYGAASGAGTGLMITGGEVIVSSGAGALPGLAIVASAIGADLAVVTGLASRAVGRVALTYGYDPEDATERSFAVGVVRFSLATGTAAKEAAFGDILFLSSSLAGGKTWAELNKRVLTRVARRIAKRMTRTLTKKQLGKILPFVGVAVGAAMNFVIVMRVVESANLAYRRRFLLEKYPHLNEEHDIAGVVQTLVTVSV